MVAVLPAAAFHGDHELKNSEPGAGPGNRAKAGAAARSGARRGLAVSAWLLKLMLPVSLAVALLERLGAIAPVGALLAPLFRHLGLPGETALVFITGALLNLYSAIAVLVTLGLDQRQVTIIALVMLIAHNLPVETAVQHKAGTPAWGIVPLRLLSALAAGFFLNAVLPPAVSPPEAPAAGQAAATAAPVFGAWLAGWVRGAFPMIFRVAVIACLVMIVQRLFEEFGVFERLVRRLRLPLRFLGLPPGGAFLWIVANTLGLAYGAAVLLEESRSGRLNRSEINLVNRSVAVCHSLLEDTLLFIAVGAWGFWITVPRLLLAALISWGGRLLRRLSAPGFSAPSSSLIAAAALLLFPASGAAAPDPAEDDFRPAVSAPSRPESSLQETAFRLEAAFPGESKVIIPLPEDDWRDRETLSLRVTPGPGAPEDLSFVVYLKDRDWWWYQSEDRPAPPGETVPVLLDISGRSSDWVPHGHRRPWNFYSPVPVRELGLKFFATGQGETVVTMEGFRLAAADSPPGDGKPLVSDVRPSAASVGLYELFELRFQVPFAFENPFDPDCVSIDARFTAPDGSETVMPAFFHQEYYFAGPGENWRDDLRPSGAPEWRVRFTPDQPGRHRYALMMSVGGGPPEKAAPAGHFEARPSGRPGFARVSGRDHRYFELDDGSFFYPIGHNIRSLNDTRYASLRGLPLAAEGGTLEFKGWLDRMAESGQNFFETWQAAWWLGLEWLDGVDGYRGIGRYNLENAWRLDWLLEQAARRDIRIQLLIINHGAVSTFCDEEWQDNPYNLAQGGFLDSPEEFFTDPRARSLFRRRLRYIVARWAYSPHIFSWEPLNEMNLVGAGRGFYRKPVLTEWYREMAAFLKEIDPWRRPVTAHYTILYDSDIHRLEDVDYVVTNAYYQERRTNLVDTLARISDFNSRFGKPQFVSEFGGSSAGGSDQLLAADLHNGLWAGYHLPFAGTPLFWWHNFIQDLDLYGLFGALARYHSGEDRLAAPLEPRAMTLSGEEPARLDVLCLAGETRALAWFYAPDRLGRPARPDDPELARGLEASIEGLTPGLYLLEFWDTGGGFPGERRYGEVDAAGRLVFPLPPANRDFALKIRRFGP